jgi:hypothetical protein
MLLSELIAERNLSPEDVTSILVEQGVTITRGDRKGDPVNLSDVTRRLQGEVPRPWRQALGVAKNQQTSPTTPGEGGGTTAAPGDDEPASSRRRETPPKRPSEAAIEVVDSAGAKKRIAWAYKFVGSGLAAGSGSAGVAHVWADQADGLAQMWLDAAKENPWAAKVVGAASAGGPMGELVAAHVYLAGASAYVLGAGIPGGDAVFAKYSKYRPPVVVGPKPAANGTKPQQEAEPAAAEPAAGAVADAPR